jgi:hypothetical protein
MSLILNLNGQPVSKTSFTQDTKHDSKSDKFKVIVPEYGQELLSDYGYKRVSLHTGRARKLENVNHQTTIATYQNETALKVGDIFPRITLKIPHIYGAVEAFAAFLRLACLNGNAYRLTDSGKTKIRHTGDAQSQFEATIKLLVDHTAEMNDSIRELQARNVTPDQVAEFTQEVARLRLGSLPGDKDSNIVSVQYDDLLRVRRAADSGQDAFTVYQIEQENVLKYGLRYMTRSIDEVTGRTNLRQLVARPITRTAQGEIETVRSVDMNVSIMELARKILLNKSVPVSQAA